MDFRINILFRESFGSISGRRVALFSILLAIVMASCDTNGQIAEDSGPQEPTNEPTHDLTPTREEVTLNSGEISVVLRTNSRHDRGHWRFDPDNSNQVLDLVGRAGLLLAIDDGIVKANAVGPASFGNSFRMLSGESDSSGFFVITQDSLNERIGNWPVAMGAPSLADGQPRMYGDLMSWAAFEPYQGPTSMDPSVENVRIDITTFLVDQFRMTNMIFIRIGMTNVSQNTMQNVRVGYGSDTDIAGPQSRGFDDCWVTWGLNQVGFDRDRNLSFVYNSPGIPFYEGQPEKCYGFVAGFSILDSSAPNDIGEDVLSHRIMRRWATEAYPDFGGESFKNAQSVLFALQGLSNGGMPMTDPTTGVTSNYAFTGDPVNQSGWIDERHDNRHMISLKPFDLNPDERKFFTVVWIFSSGVNLSNGLTRLRAFHDIVQLRRDVWDY